MIVPREIPGVDSVAFHYDELDSWYRSIWGEHVHHGVFESRRDSITTATERLIEVLAAGLALQPGWRLCDVGCGYGGSARYLGDRYGARVTGMTISLRQAAYAATMRSPNTDIRHGDFMTNGFDSGAFDGAYAVESSEHFADKPALFRQMYRIVKPAGRVAVLAWLARENPGPLALRCLLEPICREGRLPGMGARSDYEQWIQTAGFIDVAFTDLSAKVARTWTLVIRRAALQLLRDPAARAFLYSGSQNLAFGLSLFRIRAAYALGAMRYGLFTARKPGAAV